MANRLAIALAGVAGLRLAYPVQSNGVFTEVGRALADRLLRDWSVQEWSRTADGKRCVLRWMTAFDTTAEDVASLAAAISHAAADAGAHTVG
jgi:threonine aldolase